MTHLLILLALTSQVIDWKAIKTDGNIALIYDKTAWEPPVLLTALNTEGWEDSPEISWDGQRMVFLYTRIDLGLAHDRLGAMRIHSPPRAGYPDLYDGTQFGADIFVALKKPDGWDVSNIGSPINTNLGMEGCAHITQTGSDIFFSRSWTDNATGKGMRALYRSTRYTIGGRSGWSYPTRLPAPINATDLKTNTADNPFLAQGRLYWEQKQGGATDFVWINWPIKQTINPIVPAGLDSINTADNETQLWMSPDAQKVLFCRSALVIYRQNLGQPAQGIVASGLVANPPMPNAGPIGEPSMDKDGNLYFLYCFRVKEPTTGELWYDAEIAMMRPKKP